MGTHDFSKGVFDRNLESLENLTAENRMSRSVEDEGVVDGIEAAEIEADDEDEAGEEDVLSRSQSEQDLDGEDGEYGGEIEDEHLVDGDRRARYRDEYDDEEDLDDYYDDQDDENDYGDEQRLSRSNEKLGEHYDTEDYGKEEIDLRQ